jgi:hypothetical protein
MSFGGIFLVSFFGTFSKQGGAIIYHLGGDEENVAQLSSLMDEDHHFIGSSTDQVANGLDHSKFCQSSSNIADI